MARLSASGRPCRATCSTSSRPPSRLANCPTARSTSGSAISSRPGASAPAPARRTWTPSRRLPVGLPSARRRPSSSIVRGGARRRLAPLRLDLSAIAKGFGVDELARVMTEFGVSSWLVGIDGELRAAGRKAAGRPWVVGHERPSRDARALMGVIELCDCAVATSGNYRHVVEVGGRLVSHTIDPRRYAPLGNDLASVTVLAPTAMAADGWATALMVLGRERGATPRRQSRPASRARHERWRGRRIRRLRPRPRPIRRSGLVDRLWARPGDSRIADWRAASVEGMSRLGGDRQFVAELERPLYRCVPS